MKTNRLLTLSVLVIFSSIVTAQKANKLDTTGLKSKLKADFDELFRAPPNVYKLEGFDGLRINFKFYCAENDISVFDNRVELKHDKENRIIYFSDMIDCPNTFTSDAEDNSGIVSGDFMIMFAPDGKEKIKKIAKEKNKILVQDILSALDNFNKKRYKETDSFKPIAEKYLT